MTQSPSLVACNPFGLEPSGDLKAISTLPARRTGTELIVRAAPKAGRAATGAAAPRARKSLRRIMAILLRTQILARRSSNIPRGQLGENYIRARGKVNAAMQPGHADAPAERGEHEPGSTVAPAVHRLPW